MKPLIISCKDSRNQMTFHEEVESCIISSKGRRKDLRIQLVWREWEILQSFSVWVIAPQEFTPHAHHIHLDVTVTVVFGRSVTY
jgi:hypothetical protein